MVRTHQHSLRTIQHWIKRYREQGLACLADAARSDKGTLRSLPQTEIGLIERLALQTPPRSAASIYRQVTAIAKEQGWKPPSYALVRQIIKKLDPTLVTLAHQGLLPIGRILTCFTGEKRPPPKPCGRPTIPRWISITAGNVCLIHCLLMQVERILQINEMKTVTKEVVETARENLVIGLA